MPYFTYILYSEKLKRFYTGTTDNLEQRIIEHNSGSYSNSYTTKGIPWILFLKIECSSSQQAYNLEKFIKQMKSVPFIKRLKDDPELLVSILSKIQISDK
jgi:putative endonuclease